MTGKHTAVPGRRVLILGAAGFIGARLARALAAQATLGGCTIDELVLFDRRPVTPPPAARCAISVQVGELNDSGAVDRLFAEPVSGVIHLAAALTLDAERDYSHGLSVNVLGFAALLERCRAQPAPPLFMFASSISTYGGDLPDAVDDDVPQRPQTSYGTHKLIGEQLLLDATRRGYIDGRALRLPIVLTHPGPPSGSISDQVASLIREPLQGLPVVSAMAPDVALSVTSVGNVVRSFMQLADVPVRSLRAGRVMNLPGLSVTPAQIAQAVSQHLTVPADSVFQWRADPQVQAIVAGSPKAFTSAQALQLGIRPDASLEAVIRDYFHREDLLPS